MEGESADSPAAGELGATPDAETTIGRPLPLPLPFVCEVEEEATADGLFRANGYFGAIAIPSGEMMMVP